MRIGDGFTAVGIDREVPAGDEQVAGLGVAAGPVAALRITAG